MSPELQGLIHLQQLEATVADARAKIAAHPQRLAEADARLEEADREVAQATEQPESQPGSSAASSRRTPLSSRAA